MATQTEEQTVVTYLEHAVDDLKEARQQASEEVRSAIDSALSCSREALDELRADAKGRTMHLRDRAEERGAEWQKTLEGATEDMRRELGVRAVHAQRTEDALDAMQEQIKQQKKHIG